MKVPKISVVSGDIGQQKAHALITAINPGGAWFGGIDGVIQRLAGTHFHKQAAAAMPLFHEKTVVAKGGGCLHGGKFQNVVFVIDSLEGPLRNIVRNGLRAAAEAGFKIVTLPTIRMGVMLGEVERTPQEAVTEIALGVKAYMEQYPSCPIDEIIFVVYNNPQLEALLTKTLAEYVGKYN